MNEGQPCFDIDIKILISFLDKERPILIEKVIPLLHSKILQNPPINKAHTYGLRLGSSYLMERSKGSTNKHSSIDFCGNPFNFVGFISCTLKRTHPLIRFN